MRFFVFRIYNFFNFNKFFFWRIVIYLLFFKLSLVVNCILRNIFVGRMNYYYLGIFFLFLGRFVLVG